MIAATVISLCLGGSVVQHHERAISGEAFEIRGYAASACTLFLAADDVCVSDSARIMFHRPRKRVFGAPLTDAELVEWGHFIAAHYPTELASLYMRDVIYGGKTITLDGSTLIDKYGVKECD